MPCKLTLWPVELFLPTLTNKTQQKLDTENAQAAKGGKCGRRPQSRRVKGRKQKKFGLWVAQRGKYVSAPPA